MSIGQDIAEVLDELGMTVEVRRPYTDEYDWFQERIELSPADSGSSTFEREFSANGSLRYNTQIESGDVLNVAVSGLSYLVLTKKPMGFEDSIIEYSSLLYKCNTFGIVLKQIDGGEWDTSYRVQVKWVPVYRGIIPAIIVDSGQVDPGVSRGVVRNIFNDTTFVASVVHISGWHNIPPTSRYRVFSIKDFTWNEWEESLTYSKKEYVLSSDYRLFRSLIKDNTGNDPLYTSQDDFEDEYYVKCWQEIPYTDIQIEKLDFTRFENVIVYNAVTDLR